MIHIRHETDNHITLTDQETIFAGLGGVTVIEGDHLKTITDLFKRAHSDGYARGEIIDPDGRRRAARIVWRGPLVTLIVGTETAVAVTLRAADIPRLLSAGERA